MHVNMIILSIKSLTAFISPLTTQHLWMGGPPPLSGNRLCHGAAATLPLPSPHRGREGRGKGEGGVCDGEYASLGDRNWRRSVDDATCTYAVCRLLNGAEAVYMQLVPCYKGVLKIGNRGALINQVRL